MSITGSVSNERGATLAFIALCVTVLIGVIALAVDLGYLYLARTESQRVADAAALAGAAIFIFEPTNEAAARAEAMDYAARNTVLGDPVLLEESDVEVFLDEQQVRVTVYHTSERGNAPPTFFARMFGINTVDVVTDATAEAAEAGGAYEGCLLPIALVDYFEDANGNGKYDEGEYDPDLGYLGTNPYTGPIEIKTQPSLTEGPPACEGGDAFDPCNAHESWHCWWRESTADEGGGGGVDELGPRIYPGSCGEDWTMLEEGDPLYAASGTGNKQSLVTEQFLQLIDEGNKIHPLTWDDFQSCPVDPSGTCQWEQAVQSGRIRSAPIVQPTSITAEGANLQATIWQFAGLFVDKVSCHPDQPHKFGPEGQWNVYVRLVNDIGLPPGNDDVVAGSPVTKFLRLIE